jgi:hypothetical protein
MSTHGSDASHRRALVLSEVTAEGATGLSRVLRRAAKGDRDAAQIPVGALVRAVRPLGALDTHEFLLRSHIREADLAGDLGPGQRVALLSLIDRSRHFQDPRP